MPSAILVINPGSTSTKIAVYQEGLELFSENEALSSERIAGFGPVSSQAPFREGQIREALARRRFDVGRLGVVVGRGGLLHPLEGGIYRVNREMLDDLAAARYGEHASNLGAFLADRIAGPLGLAAYIADPVVVDELDDCARVVGHRLFKRRSIFHALNQKAVARRWCEDHGRAYADSRLIVAHMGGGSSVGLHVGGRVVDVNNALDGEGPFSAERSGTLPAGDLARLCFSGGQSLREVLAMINGKGGMVSLEGTNDLREIERRAEEGDAGAELHCRAFAYGVAKAIGALAAAASGRIDSIILTGGMAYSKGMMTKIENMCNFIAPIAVYPGENELEALARAGLRVLSGEAAILEYRPEQGPE
jgi:butyrate kinase